MTPLRDFEVCPNGHKDARVIDSRKSQWFRRRRHCCRTCGVRWSSWQSSLDPRRIVYRQKATTQLVVSHTHA